jgi:starch synthase
VSGSPAAFDDIGIGGETAALPDLIGWMEDKLSSIENGLDVAVWNPVTDVHLKTHFDPVNLEGKYRCKAALQHELGLPVRNDVPLFVHLSELSVDNGVDLLERCAARLLNNDLQMLVCGSDAGAADGLQELALRFPDRFKLLVSEQQDALHRALAASDLLLLSTGYQPYGVLQMCAHRYGSLPVGRKAGSVADTVVDCDSSLRTGSGFLFERNEVEEMVAAAQRGASAFRRGAAFEQLRRKVMLIDHSWERCATRYQYLYQRLAGEGRRMAS